MGRLKSIGANVKLMKARAINAIAVACHPIEKVRISGKENCTRMGMTKTEKKIMAKNQTRTDRGGLRSIALPVHLATSDKVIFSMFTRYLIDF
ncbi:MAG TPA: hypothetical protein PKI61_00700 [bacterium]|nr:hypothetical protein [bacterium]HPT29403.1 hypothetical protein [bacterium]